MIYKPGYTKFIQDNFLIVDKAGGTVRFTPNKIQAQYLTKDGTGRDAILKARQQGFSSLILAVFTADFLLKKNSRSVVVADVADNAQELLDRVKYYVKSYEEINKLKVPMRYNSKYELYNASTDSRYTIGTATSTEFGRSKTIHNLHLSEAAFYPDLQKLFAGAVQAVVPEGRVILETTANGFNYFKSLWDECVLGERPFKPLFYPASKFYDKEFLENKKGELKGTYPQEYPETPEEAFLTSGEMYFDSKALKVYQELAKDPIEGEIYV